MRRALLLIAALFVAAFGPDPEDTPTVEGAIARAIVNALPGPDEVGYGYGWQAVGSRMTYRVHWHLAEPEGVSPIRRSGWVQGDGEAVGIAACGDETVRLFTFRVPENVKRVRHALLRALAEEAQAAPEAVAGGWRVAPSWALPGLLRMEGECTSPRSAAARRCWTNVYLALREDDRDAFALACRSP